MAERPFLVLHLSAMDYGGAGTFAVDFHRLVQSVGHQSYLVVKEAKTTVPGVILYQTTPFDSSIGRLIRRVRKRSWPDDAFQYDYYFYNKYERYRVASAQRILDTLPGIPDLIFVHWVTDFINAKVLGQLKRLTNAKIYWLVIDNSPFTGGCHYPWQCRGFEQDCTDCPAVPANYRWLANENLAFKKQHLPTDLGVITFSKSDYERAQRSALFRDKPVLKWFGPVDEIFFKPGNKYAARTYFGLPTNRKIIFFGAHSLTEKRKGMDILLKAIALLNHQNVHLLIAGGAPVLPDTLPATYTGYLQESELVTAYQAADVFVCPSLEDSGPIMINQSLMCGVPVVAFDTGVAQDLIITNQTGYKVIKTSAVELANGIDTLLAMDELATQAMAERCRTLAQTTYGRAVVIQRLNDLLLTHE